MADKLNEQSATPLPRSVNSPEFRREALHPTENTSQLSNSGPGRRFRCATVIAEYVTPRLRTFHIIGPHSPPGASRPCAGSGRHRHCGGRRRGPAPLHNLQVAQHPKRI